MKVTEKEESKKQQDAAKDKTTEAGKADATKEVKETKDADTLTFEGINLFIIMIFE